MPKKEDNNDAADSPATESLDNFTVDIDKVTEGESTVESEEPRASDDSSDHGGDDGTKAMETDGDEKEKASSDGNDDDGDGADGASSNDAEESTKDSDDAKNNDNPNAQKEEAPSKSEDEADDAAIKEMNEGTNDVEDGTENEENADDDGNEEKEELWDLKVVFKPAQILQANPIRCSTAGCDLVACCIWSSNLDPENPWYCCLDCQNNDFGGWPEKKSELPIKVLRDDLKEAILEKCTTFVEAEMPDLPSDGCAAKKKMEEGSTTEEDKQSSEDDADGKDDSSSNGGEEGEDGEDGEEMWELKEVFSVKELNKAKPVVCKTDECELVACSKWVCTNDPKNPWPMCLDCQGNDFGGWPEAESGELPMKFLTKENREVIAEKCSTQENPSMPNIPMSMSLVATADNKEGDGISAITPPPGHDLAVAENQSEVVVGAARGKGGKKKKALKGGVTPSPMPPKGASKGAAGVAGGKKLAKPSAATQKTLALQAKWQAEAEKIGGATAKIVVSKVEAKKVIFDMLLDRFRPMNTNEAFMALKATVPSMILKSCLDDMVDKFTGDPFGDDSDNDEDGKSSKKTSKKNSTDEYAGSVRLKEGRNVQNMLYYIDHTKQANNGDGMLPDARNDLLGKIAGGNAELDVLNAQLKQLTANAVSLESEPKNEELVHEVADLEKQMKEMNDSLEEAKSHESNEAHVKKVRKGIEKMSSTWRKRRRSCTEFLIMMDESTDGTISLKKAMKGDGPIDLDSDEAAIKGAIAFTKRKRPRVSLAGRGGIKGSDASGGLRPDPNFVGVKLGTSGKPERVFMDEE